MRRADPRYEDPTTLNRVRGTKRFRIRQLIENDDEWNLGGRAAGFAVGEHALRFLRCCGIDQDNILSGVGSKKSQVKNPARNRTCSCFWPLLTEQVGGERKIA
jgi:hypothetical protein